jgi:hypothetical protein
MDTDLVTIRVLFEEPEEAEMAETCPHCGQGFDYRQLAASLYHRQPGHDPVVLQ